MQHVTLCLCSLLAATSQFSIPIGQKMQLTGWENANNVRNATCAASKTPKAPTRVALLCILILWLSYLLADNWVICMLSLRCRLLQYAVFVGINGWHGNNIFSIFSVSCYGILLFKLFRRRNSSIPRGKRLTMYNKAIIGFGFCDMQNYQCLGKSYLTRLRLGW